jgi:hypothetical protein
MGLLAWPGQRNNFENFEKEKRALTKEEIVERVLKQRLVKENTILMNLRDKKYFLRDDQGRYRPRIENI